MDKLQYVKQLTEQFCQMLPVDLISSSEIKKNSEAMLLAFFSKMQLVTREEFDVQMAVLERAQEKIHELETKVSELEKQLLQTHNEKNRKE